ncbi:MAG: helix-turn-helix domain-containing protein [Paludibacteraceae bacterium]|nr:helix-turn-helix domain-containing protein [Paludibacteraceae bacterium]
MQTKEPSLQMAVVPQSFLDKIEEKIESLESILRNKSEQEINSQWIESVKIPKILGISQKTWQTYRDKRLIPFSQIGSKIFVKRADLEKFMESHYIQSR